MKSLLLFLMFFYTASAKAQNVGIGTTSPFSKLHVVDSTGFSRINASTPVQSGSAGYTFTAGNISSPTDLVRWGPTASGTAAALPVANLTRLYAAGGPLLLANSGNNLLHFATNDVERMRITGDGRIKINPAFGIHDLFAFQVQGITGEGAGLFLNSGFTSGFPVVCIGRDIPASNFQTSTGEALAAISDGTDAIYCQSNLSAAINALGMGNSAAGVFRGAGPSKLSVELQGFIKVAGTDKTAFTHTATVANTATHITTLSYANAAATDIIIATPNYNPNGGLGAYNNHPIGVYWNGAAWTVFNQDFANILGTSYNILVIKQ